LEKQNFLIMNSSEVKNVEFTIGDDSTDIMDNKSKISRFKLVKINNTDSIQSEGLWST
jgi:hypothetical protein